MTDEAAIRDAGAPGVIPEREAVSAAPRSSARDIVKPHAAKRPGVGDSRAASTRPSVLEAQAFITFARADFWCFVELMFPVLYPGQKLDFAPYLELIATVLMSVEERRRRSVIINLPPRHMKSALVSVLYTAWRLGRDPTVKFICISYGDDLAHDLSAQTRKIMRSELYRTIFPGTVLDKSAMDYIRTTQGGYRYATAVGSDITGFGADELSLTIRSNPRTRSQNASSKKFATGWRARS